MATDRTATPTERVEKIKREIAGVKSLYGITSWEDVFLDAIEPLQTLSTAREESLRKIEIKVFGEAHDSHTGDLFS